MKLSLVVVGVSVPLATAFDLYSAISSALSVPVSVWSSAKELVGESVFKKNEERRLVELDETSEPLWVTEDEFWDFKRAGVKMMDITNHVDIYEALENRVTVQETYTFPAEPSYVKEVEAIIKRLDEDNIKSNLAKLSSFYTRYYKSPSGKESSLWMFDKVNELAQTSHINITTRLFEHSWAQKSVIATIPGKKSPDDIIIISAHQDSVNLFFPMGLPAPGADDDGSGTVTVLEAFKVLVDSGFEPDNTVEFHWYSAEEGGLLGSQDVFTEYAAQAKKVRAMIHQDMTGYIKTRQDKGLPEAIGIIVDNVSEELTDFLKMLVKSYTDLPVVETRCGYACSDHASASKAGYPSAVLTESEFEYSNPHVHNTEDTLDRLSFYHMAQIARVDIAGAYELAFYEFE